MRETDDPLADLLARHPAPWTLKPCPTPWLTRIVDASGNVVMGLVMNSSPETLVAAVNAAAALRAELNGYRYRYGCFACGEQHDKDKMCPPHEVRVTGMAAVERDRLALTRECAELRAENERLRAENADLNHSIDLAEAAESAEMNRRVSRSMRLPPYGREPPKVDT